ncbi:hypothetical protein GCM10007874_45120 [Labrys miyagiensis]|uniref:Uncharacterized protein n=1 Tax=Labrys miyagiensis TaxID=346912 RepID=A0ABQ6CNV4_9HYPH|nr:heparin lyase I family protein [Labrys miyagiensis]GLS21495.1 hypothetical protein GCM10007874_45120 [Labrys miyagiensis]
MKANAGSLTYNMSLPGTGVPADVDFGGLKFLRNSCPNGLQPQVLTEAEGDYLRLCVQKDAYLAATDGEPSERDRCELRDSKVKLGTAGEYSFDLRIEKPFPIVDARLVVAQIKAPYYDGDGGSPLFALRFERGNYFATVEHLYETKDVEFKDGKEISKYLTSFDGRSCSTGSARAFDHHFFGNSIADAKELQIRAIFATNGLPLPDFVEEQFSLCTSGVKVEAYEDLPQTPYEWHRFRLCVAPTKVKDYAGIVELYVSKPNGSESRLVARATGEFGHRGYEDPEHNTGPIPSEAYQYFKVGPYRDKVRLWGSDPVAIHVRNISRRAWPEGERFHSQAVMV